MSWKVKKLGGGFEHRRVTIGKITDKDFSKAKEEAKTIKARVRLWRRSGHGNTGRQDRRGADVRGDRRAIPRHTPRPLPAAYRSRK